VKIAALLLTLGLLQPFRPAEPYGPGHRGIDLPAQELVTTPLAGRVAFAGGVGGVQTVVIADGQLRMTLQPVRATVAVGQWVAVGAVVGRQADGPNYHCRECLHIGVRINGNYVDPLGVIGKRLAPVGRGSWLGSR
jgi:murein DD-endopeptidase MepM/ murein hydrolase activator NlpD